MGNKNMYNGRCLKMYYILGTKPTNPRDGGERYEKRCMPYYVGIVDLVNGQDVYVKFPVKYNDRPLLYERSNLLPFITQFPNGKFKPLKAIPAHKSIQYIYGRQYGTMKLWPSRNWIILLKMTILNKYYRL